MPATPLLLLSLLLLALPAHAASLDVQVTGQAFSHGPETWKPGVATTQGPDDLATTTASWDASLGTALDLTVTVARGGTPAGAWAYAATLSDGATVVPGVQTASDPPAFRFDVDGSRALPGQGAVQPLTAGTWTLDLEASSAAGPEGRGSATLTTHALAFDGLDLGDGPVAGVAVPESLLPAIREVGAGTNTWMPAEPLAPGTTLRFSVTGTPGDAVQWRAWSAGGTPATVPDLLAGTPLEVLPRPDALTQWSGRILANTTLDAQGHSGLGITLDADAPADLLVLSAVGPTTGGAVTFVVPITPDPHVFDALTAPQPGQEGPVTFGLRGPESPSTGPSAATVTALTQEKPGTPGDVLGGRILTTGGALADGADHWQGLLDGSATRAAAVPEYTLLALFTGPDGGYVGHATLRRGASVTLDAPVLGVGSPAEMAVQTQNLGGLDLPLHVTLRFGDAAIGAEDLVVPAGGAITKRWSHAPESAGTHALTALVDTGDLRFEARRSLDVLDADAFEARHKAWYEPGKYVPAPGVAPLLAALALAQVLRKR